MGFSGFINVVLRKIYAKIKKSKVRKFEMDFKFEELCDVLMFIFTFT